MSDRQTYLRHPLEIAPLVFGLIFLGIVVAWGLFELDVVSGGDAAWILPVVLIAAGSLGIVLAATKDRRTRRRYENMYVSAPIGAPWPTATDERLDDTATTEHTLSMEHTGATEDTRPTEDTATTEIRDPEQPVQAQPDEPDHTDDPDDHNQPGATR